MLHFLKYWLPPIAYAGLIFFLSSRPLPEIPVRIPYIDKAAHLIEYAILAMLLYRACMHSNLLRSRSGVPITSGRNRAVAISILVAILYGLSDEVHQFYVPGRLASGWDFMFDALGAVAGVVIIRKLISNTSSKRRETGVL
ncbi:MAG: VanZ family protein [Planctomycetota bacterium]